MATRLETIVNGVSSEARAELQTKKIQRALAKARSNAADKKETAEVEMEELIMGLTGKCPEQVIEKISEKMDDLDEAQAELNRVDRIEAYLNSEAKEKTTKKK